MPSLLEKSSRSSKEKKWVLWSKEKTKDNTAKWKIKTSLNRLILGQGVQEHSNNCSFLFIQEETGDKYRQGEEETSTA